MNGLTQALLWGAAAFAVGLSGIVAAAHIFSPLAVFNALLPKDGGVAVIRDIAYGPDARHRLDIYRPELFSGLPVLFFGYGGGWDSGDKADYAFVGHAFAARGFVTVIANYRLVPEVVYPEFVADTALALTWAQQGIAEHGGDAGRIFLMGHSAGAYNVAMLALDPQFGIAPSSIVGVVGLSGPYDFYPFDVPASRNAFGSYPEPELTQPVNHASADAPPMLLIHGGRDETVLPRNSTALHRRLVEAGTQPELKIYEGAGHGDTLISIGMPLRWRYPMIEDALDFMRRNGAVVR